MSFHKAISDSLFNQQTSVKIDVLSGLHERGALDLDVLDEHGETLLGHMSKRQALPPEIIDFLDGIGRSDVYAQPKQGSFSLLDQHLRWLEQSTAKTTKIDDTLARMIARVDRSWWLGQDNHGDDPGSAMVATLAQCKCSHLSLTALWNRGVATDARLGLPDRPLAVRGLSAQSAFQAYLDTGADLSAPLDLSGNSPAIWRVILAQSDEVKDLVKETVDRGRIEPGQGGRDLYLKDLRLMRSNRADMIKHLFSRPDWQEIHNCYGTPAWLYAVSQRGDVLGELIERKRKRPDFAQRDHRGRSAWFWGLLRGALNPKEPELLARVMEELPPERYLPDSQGRGIMTQIAAQVLATGKTPQNLMSFMAMLDGQSDEVLFAGLDEVDFSVALPRTHNGGSDLQCPPLMGLALLCTPRANAFLTPSQRGHIVATTLLNDIYMNSYYKDQWLSVMDKQPHLLEPLSWPEPDTVRLHLRDRNEYNGGERMLALSKALRGRWQMDWQAQEIGKHTTPAAGRSGRPRF